MIELLFFLAGGLLFYSYLIYPFVILLLFRRKPHHHIKGLASKSSPSLSLILAVHDEEAVIEAKIENFFACSYSGERELVVVSDGSTDSTAAIARSIVCNGRIKVIEQEERLGKGQSLNIALKHATGEIVIFTDANSFFDDSALIELVKPFRDLNVGLVTGSSQYTEHTIGSVYQRYEQWLKRCESLGGVIATADGAIYAMRRNLWREQDRRLINDFTHPMLTNLSGFAAVFSPGAICREEFTVSNEFARQARMVSQASYAYAIMLPKLVRAGCWRTALVLTSHKLLRWLTMPLLVIALASSLFIEPRGELRRVVLSAELVFAFMVLAGAIAKRLSLGEQLTIVYEFLILNCAGALGLWRGLMGAPTVVWQPRGK